MRNQLQYMSTVYLHGNEEIKFESNPKKIEKKEEFKNDSNFKIIEK